MSAPKPGIITQVADDLDTVARTVAHRYAALYPSGYEQRRGGQQGSGGDEEADTSRLIVSTDAHRAKLEEAAKATLRAFALLRRADSCLGELEDMIDKGADRTIMDPEIVKSVPRSEWRQNHRDGLDAYSKRRDRGEHLPGDGGLPRAQEA